MHAPGHLREAFLEWADTPVSFVSLDDEVGEDIFYDGEPRPIRWVMEQLWNCSDIMPGDTCVSLAMERGSSYAQAVQSLLV
jgi:hypothetical protein